MTVLDGQVLDAGTWPFRHRLDELDIAGVQLAPEQIEMFNRAVNQWPPPQETGDWMYALTTWVPRDVTERYFRKPQYVWKPGKGGLWTKELLVLPRAVRLDWYLGQDLDQCEPHWRRFPTLPGRLVAYEDDDEEEEGFRLWNLWPLPHWQVDIVQDYYRSWMEEWATPYENGLYQHYFGLVSACDEHEGECTDPDTGQPYNEDAYVFSYGTPCGLAEEAEQSWREEYLTSHDEDGRDCVLDPRLQMSDLLYPVNEAWQAVQSYAARNSHAATQLLSERERDEEGAYSPWLWSS